MQKGPVPAQRGDSASAPAILTQGPPPARCLGHRVKRLRRSLLAQFPQIRPSSLLAGPQIQLREFALALNGQACL